MALPIPRLGVVRCPQWPVVAAGAGADEPVAVMRAMRIVACSVAAGRTGVTVGMRRRDAQSRCPGLRLVPWAPEQERRAFDEVARAVGEVVPRLELTEPGTLTFAARGPTRWFGGEEVMAAEVATRAAGAVGSGLDAVGGVVGVGVADGRFTAMVAARAAVREGRPVLVPPGRAADFLAPLPVALLSSAGGVDPDLVDLLGRLGVRQLGQVAELPVVDLVERFGPLGGFVHRLAAAGDDRPPGTVDPPVGRAVQRVFEDPVHHSDTLVFVTRHLADDLLGGLAGSVCIRLAVTVETEHGERSERLWYRPEGLGTAAIVERVRWQLDAWARTDEVSAGVVLVRLDPVEVRPDDGTQLTLWGGASDADGRAARAVARLAALAGEQHVVVPVAAGGRQPGDAYTWVPATLVDLAAPDRCAPPPVPWPGRLPMPSPAVVHPEPVAVEVLDERGMPVRVDGRGIPSAAAAQLRRDGRVAQVRAWAGPWPIDERWWDPRRARRAARAQLLIDDGSLVLVHLEGGRWWLTAEYR